MSHARVQDQLLVSEILPVLDELSSLAPDDCLQRLTEVLRRELNCETAAILLWSEGEGKLITRYSTGMPAGLGPERYDWNQGITGKYIFSGECVRYLINTEALEISNAHTGKLIVDPTINWKYIQAFKRHSLFKDFRSLLGVPFFVKNQKIGVVKLINKKDNASGKLASGFSENDERILLSHYLRTIQYVVNAKRNEEQSKALLKISERNTSAVFEFKQVLTDAAKTCAESLNYRVCVIRLLEDGRLSLKATSTDVKIDDNYVDKCDPSFLAFAKGTAVVWNKNGLSDSNALELTRFDGSRRYLLPSPSERILQIIRDRGLNSFLIAPIRLRKEPIGTIECYTSLPHQFSKQELDTINTYGSFVATAVGAGEARKDLQRSSENLLKIIDQAAKCETFEELYNSILDQTIEFFGFDYGAIARFDRLRETIKIVVGKSRKPRLVNPNEWIPFSNYKLEDEDILVDILKRKQPEVFDGRLLRRQWDRRFNKEVFDKFHHENLIRIYVPFHFKSESEDHALGVVEAGFHIDTQQSIPDSLKRSYILFINSCATSLQKAILVDEKTYADTILEKLIRIEDPYELLSSLLAESIALVGGDSGDITLLTHIDEKLRLTDPPITFGIAREKRTDMIHPLSVSAKDSEGIVGHVARTRRFYWSGDVQNDDKYLEEFKEVKSELAVPLLYSEKVIGVLNINSNHKERFNDRKGNLVQSIADRATILYQKARVTDLLKLVTPFSVFSKVSDLYATIIKLIERFLKTDAVSIWEKTDIEGGDFQLDLVDASPNLRKKYAKKGIEHLESTRFTARAVKNREVEAVGEREIGSADFAFSEFAVENGFKHMTSVPIRVGQAVYAVIDVFSRRPVELFPEEIAFLERIASKAAMAIQGSKLIRSFNDISESLLNDVDDIESCLNKITDSARELLHADPVILYRYETNREKFILPPVASGTFLGGDIREAWLKKNTELRENDIANVIRKHGTMYFKDVKAFSRFTKKIGRKYRPHHFKRQFWYRENIRSLAALSLEHAGTVVGVMFVNFRTEQDFTQSRRLIEAYAGQAALAIVNARLAEEINSLWEFRRNVSMAFSASEAMIDSAHNSNNLLNEIVLDYIGFTDDVKKSPALIDKELCETFIKDLRRPLNKLKKNLRQYRNFYNIKRQPCDVQTLIENSLLTLQKRLQGVKVRPSYGKTPMIFCDKNQMQDVFVNILLNSYEAMTGNREKIIDIKTSVDTSRGNIEIRFSDNGRGISPRNRSRVFERGFTTKKGATDRGLGLSISRYMVHSHGGEIKLASSERSKGTTFSILLPIKGQNTDETKNPSRR